MLKGTSDVSCRSDKITKAMVVATLRASDWSHASDDRTLLPAEQRAKRKCRVQAVRDGDNSRGKLQKVVVNGTAQKLGYQLLPKP